MQLFLDNKKTTKQGGGYRQKDIVKKIEQKNKIKKFEEKK